MKLITYLDGSYEIVDKHGKSHSTPFFNIMLIIALQQCNIDINAMEEAIIDMQDNNTNVSYFGIHGTFLYSERDYNAYRRCS